MRRAPLLLLAAALGCHPTPSGPPRDWAAHPVVQLEDGAAVRVWVCSDVHGGRDRLVRLLTAAHLVDDQLAWSGGTDRLYVLGDLFDKALGGLEVVNLVRALQPQAEAAGGKVVVTLGNHEAEFLADPDSGKSSIFTAELKQAGLDPFKVASGEGVGAWLRDLPVALKDGDWFFSHSGNTRGETVDELSQRVSREIDANQFATPALIGIDSVLEARQWWKDPADDEALVERNLLALGARHLVFGHDPNGFGTKGSLGQRMLGRLFLVDVGMSPGVDYSEGVLMLLERTPSTQVQVLFPDGTLLPFYAE